MTFRQGTVRALIVVSSIILFLSVITVASFADDSVYSEGYLEYIIEDNSITITGYFGNGGEVYVPDMIAGYPVSKIASGAFTDIRITCVYLPDTIVEVKEGALGQGISVVFDYNTGSGIPSDSTVTENNSADPDINTDNNDDIQLTNDIQQSADLGNQDEHYDAGETILLNDNDDEEQETEQNKAETSMKYIIGALLIMLIFIASLIFYKKKKQA